MLRPSLSATPCLGALLLSHVVPLLLLPCPLLRPVSCVVILSGLSFAFVRRFIPYWDDKMKKKGKRRLPEAEARLVTRHSVLLYSVSMGGLACFRMKHKWGIFGSPPPWRRLLTCLPSLQIAGDILSRAYMWPLPSEQCVAAEQPTVFAAKLLPPSSSPPIWCVWRSIAHSTEGTWSSFLKFSGNDGCLRRKKARPCDRPR